MYCAARHVQSLNYTLRRTLIPHLLHPDFTFLVSPGSTPSGFMWGGPSSPPPLGGPWGGSSNSPQGGLWGGPSSPSPFGGPWGGSSNSPQGGLWGGPSSPSPFGGPWGGSSNSPQGGFWGGPPSPPYWGGPSSYSPFGGFWGASSPSPFGMHWRGMFIQNPSNIDCTSYTFPGLTDDQILQEAETAVRDGKQYLSNTWQQQVDAVMQCVNSQPGQSTSSPTADAMHVQQVYGNMTLTLNSFANELDRAVQAGMCCFHHTITCLSEVVCF